jgi:hypothetical protein
MTPGPVLSNRQPGETFRLSEINRNWTRQGHLRKVATFDLTFKGKVLPGHDPEHVKAGFAELFCIEDSKLVEQLFSGQEIILRSGLNRKSAAEYFSRIRRLGAEAALIDSGAQEAEQTAVLLQEDATEVRIVKGSSAAIGMNQEFHRRGRDHVDQTWPVSAARVRSHSKPARDQTPQPTPARAESGPGHHDAEQHEPAGRDNA